MIEANFNQTCVQLARHLHDDDVIEYAIGKPAPVVTSWSTTTESLAEPRLWTITEFPPAEFT